MEYNEQISHINSLLQEIETKIVYMQDNVKKVNSSSTSNSADISSVNEQLNSLKNTVNNLQTNVSSLQSLANGNNSQIQSINTTLTTLQTQIATLEQNVNANTANIATLEQNVSTNTNSISTINTTIEQINNSLSLINTQIEQLQDSATSSCNCQEQMTAISTKVTNMETIVNNFTTLIKDRNRAIDTTFTQIDPETVVQTYDCMEKIYDYTGTSTYHSALFEFCVQEGTTSCTLKLILNINSQDSSSTGEANLNLYLNASATPITQSFNYNNLFLPITFTFDLPITTAGNFFYFTVSTTNNVAMNFTKAKAEVLNCTNPIFLNKVCPFSVDYFNGKYYLTDCTGEYAKIAEINASDIATINDIVWTETTYKAQGAVTIGKMNETELPYFVDGIARYYLLKDCSFACESDSLPEPKFNSSCKYAYIANNYMDNYFSCLSLSMYSTTHLRTYNLAIKNNNISLSNYTTNLVTAFYGAIKTKKDAFSRSESAMIRPVQNINGDCEFKYGNTKIVLTKGRILHAYSDYISGYHLYTVYTQVYNQIVKFVVKYNGNLSVLSSQVVGTYDNYFEGVNNDYFVVKDNKLYYYKDNLQNVIE